MKSYTGLTKKHTPGEIAESLVFPVHTTKKEREKLLDDFRAVRKHVSGRQTPESKRKSQLLQLKFIIEDYLQSQNIPSQYFFGYFLKEYITRIEKKNKEFALEIAIDPAELSQVINRHRKPTDKLIYRLDIHSNKNFPALLWFAVLEKERAIELAVDKSIIESEKIHVKHTLEFSI